MTSAYRRDHEPFPTWDEYERLSEAGRDVIDNASAFFEGQADTPDTPVVSEAERRALKRAMARFVIDSGIASVRGWV
jgi:hypothetical protein